MKAVFNTERAESTEKDELPKAKGQKVGSQSRKGHFRPGAYSEMMWSAHSTKETKMAGLPNFALQFARSLSETARAREQAPQAKTGMCLATSFSRNSLSAGQPMGITASEVALRMR